jgi:outer membrane receptor protein involved in Fe transport
VRYLLTAPFLGRTNRFTLVLQYAGTNQHDKNFANEQGQRGDETKNQTNKATNVGAYLEEQCDATNTLTLVAGGRLQYAYRSVSDHFLTNGDQSGSVDFFAVSPKLGVIWHVTPTVQVCLPAYSRNDSLRGNDRDTSLCELLPHLCRQDIRDGDAPRTIRIGMQK